MMLVKLSCGCICTIPEEDSLVSLILQSCEDHDRAACTRRISEYTGRRELTEDEFLDFQKWIRIQLDDAQRLRELQRTVRGLRALFE